MFDYPIPPIRGGLYTQLGLSPEATADEINEAQQALTTRMKRDLKSLQKELDQVYRAVPDLKQMLDRIDSLMTTGTEEDLDSLRQAQADVMPLEEQARSVNPRFRSLRDQVAQIERDISEANILAIQNPEERKEYDRSHPPFEIIKLTDCGTSPIDDRRLMLAAIRTGLTEFLEQSGETVAHPSDLTRTDFTQDYSYDPTLDRTK